MTVNEAIEAAVEPLVPVCVPDRYDGDAPEYCVFNANEVPSVFGDDCAEAIRYLVQVHYFLPRGQNATAKKRQIRHALEETGFTSASIENASDEDGQHWVIECEWLGGA